MSAVVDEELRAYVASVLHKPVGTAPDGYWVPLVNAANESARNEIFDALLTAGFTADQISSWRRFREVNLQHGLYLCGELNKEFLSPEQRAKASEFNWRDRLAAMKVLVLTDGSVVQPGATGVRQSSSGSLAWPAAGRVRNPLLDVPRRCGDVPYPSC
jgi:hypothetical protein